MIHPLACLLLLPLLQTAPDGPPLIEGTSLPFVELKAPEEHGGLDLFRFSPDGELVAGATGVGTMTWDGVQSRFGGEVILWDAKTGRIIKTLGAHAATPTMLQFSSDGSRLLSYSREDHDARLWSVPDGALLAECSLGGTGARGQPPILGPDGRILVHLAERTLEMGEGVDVPFMVEAWHLDDGRRLWARTVEQPEEAMDARFAISPDGTTVVISHRRMLWSEDGDRVQGRHLGGAHELLRLESGESVWSVPLPEKRRSGRPHPEKQVLFTPDGSEVLMVGRSTVHRYATNDGSPVGEPLDLKADESVEAIRLSSDGGHLMVTRFFDRQLEVRRFPGGAEVFRVLFTFPDKLASAEPAPDLRHVVGRVGFSDPRVIDLSSGFDAPPE